MFARACNHDHDSKKTTIFTSFCYSSTGYYINTSTNNYLEFEDIESDFKFSCTILW